MDKYVICIQVPDILSKISEEISNEEEKKDLEEIFDLLEEFEDNTEYADIYFNGELMVCFEAPSEKSAKGLFKMIRKILKEIAKEYHMSFELCTILEDSSLHSILYEKV